MNANQARQIVTNSLKAPVEDLVFLSCVCEIDNLINSRANRGSVFCDTNQYPIDLCARLKEHYVINKEFEVDIVDLSTWKNIPKGVCGYLTIYWLFKE